MTLLNQLLCKYNYSELPNEDINIVYEFITLWMFFEGKHLEKDAKPQTIEKFIADSINEIYVDQNILEQVSSYFYQRYSDPKFLSGLKLEPGSKYIKNSVLEFLAKYLEKDPRILLTGCIGIIYRYRNNLLHGEKLQYGIQSQKPNFEHANLLLRCILLPDTE